MRMPAARPASGSGIARCRASPAASGPSGGCRPSGGATIAAARLEAAGGPGAPQVVAVRVVVGRGLEPAARPRRSRRRGPPGRRGERRGDLDGPRLHEQVEARDLAAVARRADRDDDRRATVPCPSGSGGGDGAAGPARTRSDRTAAPAPAATAAAAGPGSRVRTPAPTASAGQPGGERDDRRQPGDGRARAGDAAPTASQARGAPAAHGPTVTSARSFSSVAAPTTLRDAQVVDARERLLLAGGDDLGRGRRARRPAACRAPRRSRG